MDDTEKKIVTQMINDAIAKSNDFKTKKRGDTPTDSLQLTPEKYVDMNGTRANRPKTIFPGQQYFSTQDHYPWFTDGISSWFSGTGSIVSAL